MLWIKGVVHQAAQIEKRVLQYEVVFDQIEKNIVERGALCSPKCAKFGQFCYGLFRAVGGAT